MFKTFEKKKLANLRRFSVRKLCYHARARAAPLPCAARQALLQRFMMAGLVARSWLNVFCVALQIQNLLLLSMQLMVGQAKQGPPHEASSHRFLIIFKVWQTPGPPLHESPRVPFPASFATGIHQPWLYHVLLL